jgi:N-acetylmuramoyl-L-alanine amidase|tara:strand:+ start:3092 stop:5215 length:2124 start_codon:yes stop_codon:yes gene_type:complete
MALNKTDLNLVLNAEGRKKEVGNARFQDQSISAIEETFVKTTTTLGQEDGKILGGIKSLGQSTNSSEEVITSAVGLITDTLPALSGAKGNVLTVTNATVLDSDGKFLRYKLPSDSDGSLVLNALSIDSAGGVVSVVRGLLGRDSDDNARSFGSTTTSVTALTGLPALKANVPTSALAVVTDGTGQSIAECVSIAEQKKNADFAEITAFTDVIEAMRPPASAGGGLFGKIKSAMSAVSFAGGLGATLNQLAPVAALNDTLAQVTSKVNELETLALGATEKFAALGTEAMAIGDGILQSTLDQVTNITGVQDLIAKGNKLKDQLDTLPTINDVIGTDLSNVVDVVNKVTDEVNTFEADFNQRIDKGLLGTLQNVAEGLTGDAASYISNLVSGGIVSSDQERQQILAQFSSDDPRQKKEAVKTLTGKSINVSERMKSIIGTDENTSTTLEMQVQMIKKAREQGVPEQEIAIAQQEISTIDDKMSKLDTTIGGSVVVEASLFEEAVSIDQSSKWSGRNSPDDIFTYISSVEELDAEFTNVHREVTEVIVHASETHTNKNIGAIEINNIHTELGHDGIGYHYVIRRDGRLQRGRPVNTEGEHAIVNGHDKRSIGLVMVGGLNVSTGEDNPTNYRSAQSFTREQFTTLEKFFASYYRRFPGGQVFGHNDVDEAEHDPYFDVVDYVDSVFRKKNKLIDPKTNGPMSPSEINSDN